ncbi:hypothetical protein E5288_WYG019739 [Bos mutus]|uniref:MAGE domain-containing protein n=1 Tax=Bos mutus TaxID=72004 RepID=A0A6B0SBF3_9CETA|nr:hypothetical protein [Bos mutus]
MLKVNHRSYREEFPEILRRDSECMELEFGLVLKEVRPNSHCYTLVSNLDLSDSESMRGDWGLQKNGLLMPLLGVTYLNAHRASEEDIWKFLNMLNIYDGRRHFIFGDTGKLITQDLVQEVYLEYRQVPSSDPPRYEFLWGPKALTQNSKTKVLQILTRVNDSAPDTLQPRYEDSWREEVESSGARAAAGTGPSASASTGPSALPVLAFLPQPDLALLLQLGLTCLPRPGPALLPWTVLAILPRPDMAHWPRPDMEHRPKPGLTHLPRPVLALLPQPVLALLP